VDAAKRIKSSLRDEDMVGRYGGEEFMVILHNTALDVAKLVAERIRLRIADNPIISADLILHVTASLGLSTLNASDDLKSLVKRADEALYAAKHDGRNRVVIQQSNQ
jgi:diguanylate cyclase (GGDEF)-like protein